VTGLSGTDGRPLPGHLAAPTGPAGGGVVVIHEWWGLNAQTRGIAERLAKEGFVAFAPDLYGGKVATSAGEAQRSMQALDRAAALGLLARAVQALGARGLKVGVLGFCMGGALALSTAETAEGVTACVPFYGIPASLEARRIRAAVQAHYATHDEWCTPARVDALEKALKAAGVRVEVHRYEAQHAFFNEQRPEVYSQENAQRAWERTVGFLRAQLGGTPAPAA
jgi:carboxymethylenebutenolidase